MVMSYMADPFVKWDYEMGQRKSQQFANVKQSLQEVEQALHTFDEEDKKELMLFISEVKHKLINVIEKAVVNERYFGCWLRENHTYMPMVLYSIPQVKFCYLDNPAVRAMKEQVITALEIFLNASSKID